MMTTIEEVAGDWCKVIEIKRNSARIDHPDRLI
jgi:hypothetical protein